MQVDVLSLLTWSAVQTRDSRGIYLPNYIEPVSHIAVDVSTDTVLQSGDLKLHFWP